MQNLLLHGLGQNAASWEAVKSQLASRQMEAEALDLYGMLQGRKAEYGALLESLTDYCNGQDGKLNLCGLSLGGVLALDYAKRFPERVNSLVVIGAPYQIPKFLLQLQSMIFRVMPKSAFEEMGCGKKTLRSLASSMGRLDIPEGLEKIHCPVLVLCGEKDSQNQESAQRLHQQLKGSVLQIVPGAAHEVNVENPQALAQLLYDFWGRGNLLSTF